jgi:hypothetical protein
VRISVDLDGVSVQLHQAFCHDHNAQFGTDLHVYDITEWEFLPLTHFNTWDELWPWVREHQLFRIARPYPYLQKAIARLEAAGHFVAFVTHRPQWAQKDTYDWLYKHRLGCPVIFTENKVELDEFNLFIDDSPLVLEDLARLGKRAIRMVRPWNRPVAGVLDAAGWVAVLGLILIDKEET